jgi:hypothetical protein
MIRYALTCANGHDFESWFQSATAFAALQDRGLLSCAVCGSGGVAKALMAPAVRSPRDTSAGSLPGTAPGHNPGASAAAASGPAANPHPAMPTARPSLGLPDTPLAEKIAELRREIEANAEYVGADFAAEARAIQEGEAPARSIYGEAHRDAARQLIEDGVPVAPLPFLPQRRAN